MQLKSLMVDSKDIWIDYPGLKGFKVQVATLSRKELLALRKGCTITKFNRQTRQPEEEMDTEKFVERFTKKTVKSWKGLTMAHLETLVLINVSEDELDTELPYNPENAEMLVNSSSEFDGWLNEVVFDLDNFRSSRDRGDVEETGDIS